MSFTVRHKLGAVALDLPRFIWAMRPRWSDRSGLAPWLYLRNRNEQVIANRRGKGVACDWQWTSDLHIAQVFPSLGLSLMRRALLDWPVILQGGPNHDSQEIEISFIIGHRGTARLPHLLLTLQSIAAQRGVAFECIVVEQSETPMIKSALPQWVRYVHTPLPYSGMPYCRSWTFNVGARQARGRVLILHDNDMLVPQNYASEILCRYQDGYEIINLKRFIFYLSQAHSEQIFLSGQLEMTRPPEVVVQNLEAGGSLAVSTAAYFALGGFDESFVGWGGEDNEFWERAQTRSVWPYGYLPILHLWHAAQPEKAEQKRQTAELYESRSTVPAQQRIAELTTRKFGDLERLASADWPGEQGIFHKGSGPADQPADQPAGQMEAIPLSVELLN
jgi:N-terminal domain of galactosyltransferase